MPFKIVRNDITKMQVDAIVNTANEAPQYSSGVDHAVYKAAGEELLLAERKKIGWMDEGEVAITPGFNLPARYIIHAVSPCYIDGTFGEEEKLRRCYKDSLELAYKNGCASIAFPLIATGSFGYPKEEGMRIAVDEINAFLLNHRMLIYLVVFDKTATRLGRNLYPDLEAYIDQNYVSEKRLEEYGEGYTASEMREQSAYERQTNERQQMEQFLLHRLEVTRLLKPSEDKPSTAQMQSVQYLQKQKSVPQEHPVTKEQPTQKEPVVLSCEEMDYDTYEEFQEEKGSAIKERMKHLTDSFQEYLFYLIEQKNLENVDVYKRAIINKKNFSKIKTNPNYHPDKSTALRLCVGALLNLDETKDLLARAGYALSPCDKRDIIFSYFIEKGIYDLTEIDITMEEHGLPCFIN